MRTCVCVCIISDAKFADNLLIHRSSESNLTLFNPSNDSTEELISSSEWAELVEKLGSPISNVLLSHDRKKAMLVTHVEKVRGKICCLCTM